MHSEPTLHQHLARSTSRAERAAFAAIALAVAVVFGAYWQTFLSMLSTWQRSETFAHGFIALPVFFWLVWRARERLAAIAPRPFLPALALVAALGVAWKLGELASVLVVSQFAVTLMIPALLWAALGTELVLALAFPFVFLLFAVPIGEAFVPKMMDWTADFTVLALRVSGVPVYREGNEFLIPSGAWSVVEACSGIRYLIASVVGGTLYAYLSYRSLTYRAAFIGLSVVVPVVANWVRAYTIVMLGHLSGNRIAIGVDHLIYGWVFFGVVMVLLFWFGSRWREPAPAASATRAPDAVVPRFALRGNVVTAAAVAGMVGLAWAALPLGTGPTTDQQPVRLDRPAVAGGWQPVPDQVGWSPHFDGWQARLDQRFARDGMPVGLFVGYYRDQRQGRELVGSLNQMVVTTDRDWRLTAGGSREIPLAGDSLRVRTAEIRGRSDRLVAWQWYWVDNKWTANDYLAKAWLAWARLLGRGDDSAVVVVHASREALGDRAETALETFVTEMLPGIEQSLARAGGRP